MSDGLAALTSVRPVWTRLVRASEVIGLPGRWLLHAGPPFAVASEPCPPVLSSAVLACLYEGWASSEGEAERRVRGGEVTLVPAQAQRCVTPLAALVSPSTTLIEVGDEAGTVPPVYAPLGTTGGPDLRFGIRDMKILERLALRDREQASKLRAALGSPVALLPIAREATGQGDDLHNRTSAATAALAARIGTPLGASHPLVEAINQTPLYFLTFWMAAAKLMLSAAERKAPPTLIVRMGGNGEAFGMSLAATPDCWINVPAEAPQGTRLPNAGPNAAAIGALGDSAVIDALGFGGQALEYAPEPRAALAPYLNDDPVDVSHTLLQAAHPELSGKRVGLDAAIVLRTRIAPIVTLGMVEASGTRGLLGRGVYRPPLALFERALENA